MGVTNIEKKIEPFLLDLTTFDYTFLTFFFLFSVQF